MIFKKGNVRNCSLNNNNNLVYMYDIALAVTLFIMTNSAISAPPPKHINQELDCYSEQTIVTMPRSSFADKAIAIHLPHIPY